MQVTSEIFNKTKTYRLLEMLPGAMMLIVYIGLLVLSFFKPLWVIVFIILYSLLWLVRVGYFVVYLFIAWGKYRREVSVDWFEQVKKIQNWQRLYHYVLLPTWKEPVEVLEHTITELAKSSYPNEKIIVHLAGEERAGEAFLERAEQIKQKFGNTFFKLIVTVHPKDLPNEVVGKGANAHYAGKEFKKILDSELQIPYENIVVSNFDSDTVVHHQYFARLAYAYLTHPNPTRASYQPLALYNNNLWESPSFTRVVANSTTFWLMTELARPEQFMTFSSHSMSFKALVDVGFWEKTIITEDSRIFLQCYLRYDGDYSLVPIYVPISMDTVAVETIKGTIKNQYLQIQRWAWSVEHQPFLITHFARNKVIPFWEKIRYTWKLIEGQLSWATAPILLLVFTRLPIYIAQQQQNISVLVQNAPFVIETILQIAMIGMVLSAYFNIKLLPGPPAQKVYLKYGSVILQWLLLPITLIIFGTIPAIDAQMRLFLGKELVFWNTEKARIKNN